MNKFFKKDDKGLKELVLRILGIAVVSGLFYLLINEITTTLNIFYPFTGLILSILFFIALITHNKSRVFSLVAYLLFIICFLFLREKAESKINLKFYLFTWLKLILKNKIVFINIFGNLLLFLPLSFYLRKSYEVIYLILFIVILELFQYLTNRGIFDIVDIVLNICGLTIGLIIRRIYGRRKKETY